MSTVTVFIIGVGVGMVCSTVISIIITVTHLARRR